MNVFGWSTDLTQKVLKERDGLSIKSATRKHQLDRTTTSRRRKKVDYKEVSEVSGTTRKGIKKGVPRPAETDEQNSEPQPSTSGTSGYKKSRRGERAYSPGGGD